MVVVAIIVISIGVWACSTIWHAHKLNPLKPHLDEYLATVPSGESMNARPHIAGKVVVVDRGSKIFDYLVFDLPAKLRATAPEQVGTVVLTEYTAHAEAHYKGGGIGYRWSTRVSLMDFATGELFARNRFDGIEPPRENLGRGDGYGEKPIEQVVDWLTSLPAD